MGNHSAVFFTRMAAAGAGLNPSPFRIATLNPPSSGFFSEYELNKPLEINHADDIYVF